MNGKISSWSVSLRDTANSRKRELLVFWILAAAIFVMRLWHISELHAPIMYNDEIGYWSHAANLAGLSWTKTESAWYSYGYSLILLPLFWLTHNMEILYRLAIGENALLGVLGFWAGFHIILELNEDFDKTVAMFLSFVAASYSAYMFQSTIAWSETLVYTWFMLTALLGVRFCKNPTYRNTALLTAAVAALYVIHNRTLAIWIALLLTLVYMLIRRRITWKHVLLAVGILAVVYVANSQMKEYVNTLMWGSEKEFRGNNVSAQSKKVKQISSFSGLRKLLRSLAGKVWYLFSSTLLTGYLGMLYLLKAFLSHVRDKRPTGTTSTAKTGLDSAYLFLGLSVLGTLAVTVITALPRNISGGGSYDRLDVLFYGRYTDMVTGLLIMLGLAGLYQGSLRRRNIRSVIAEALSGLLIYGLCLIVIQAYFSGIGDYGINVVCVPGVFFRSVYTASAISFKQITAIAATLFVLIVLGFCLFRVRLEKIMPDIRCLVIGLAMVCVFWKTAGNAYNQYTGRIQTSNYNNYSDLTELLNANTQYTICCKGMGTGHLNMRQYIRVSVVEGNIVYSTPDEDNYFLIADSENLENVDFTAKQYYYIRSYWGVHVLVVGNELAADLESQGYECISISSLEDIEILADGGSLDE